MSYRLQTMIDERLKNDLEAAAKREKQTVSAFVRQAILVAVLDSAASHSKGARHGR